MNIVGAARLAGRSLAAREALLVGQALPAVGPWQLTRLVGVGRWARVFRARPSAAPAREAGDFAIKLLWPQFAHDPLARAMLRREALVAGQVQHSQLVAVLADHSAASEPYLVQPFLDGVTLRGAIASAALLPLSMALLIVRQVAEGLAALHAAGWLHGDVKPANIVVAPSGHTTLIDLGMARRLESDETSAEHVVATTLAYAAPECFSRGEWLSGAADIYSLGAVLFELLVGRPVFAAENPAELVRHHRRATPADVREARPDAPQELAALVHCLLAKEPLRRPEADRLVRELAALEIAAI